ncbi:MAG: hypothetical protein Q4D24_07500 [Erysipelotrichaceae bacterium]|nr:hypothetical protein [Erysipelotrichaceae bacterium]
MKHSLIKKTAAACISLLMLAGCSTDRIDVASDVNRKLAEAVEIPAHQPIYNSTCYMYYKEPYVGRITSDLTSNVFSLNGTQFVMNLNVPGIINKAYYPGQTVGGMNVKGASIILETAGKYENYDGEQQTYVCRIYRSSSSYVTIMTTDYGEFFAVSKHYEVAPLAYEMLVIAKSLDVDTSEVLDRYSSHSVISYQKKKLELFQNITPVNGVIDELFVDSNSKGMKLGDNGDYMEASPSATPDEPLWPVYSETEAPETAEPEETGKPD